MNDYKFYAFGELLKGFRKREDLTQAKLATELGICRGTIIKWESYEFLPRYREDILKLEEALSLSEGEVDQLLDAVGYPLKYSTPDVIESKKKLIGADSTIVRVNFWTQRSTVRVETGKKSAVSRQRRQFTPEFKLEVILEGLHGEKSITQICRERGITHTVYYSWQDRFLVRAATIFAEPTQQEKAAVVQDKITTELSAEAIAYTSLPPSI